MGFLEFPQTLHLCDPIRRIDFDYSPTTREPKNICSHGKFADTIALR